MTGRMYEGRSWSEANSFLNERCGTRPRQECTIGPRTTLRRVSAEHIAIIYGAEIIIRYTLKGAVWLWTPITGPSEAVRSRFNSWAPCGIDLGWRVLFRTFNDERGNIRRFFDLADGTACPVQFYTGINVGVLGSDDADIPNRV